ncbi:hypothetical protein VNO77_14460 [Canavalia gladiata]|uniref:Uncharacterized protein n=1 Tax=Canavalia gladiata TaxID=3824 RepID=A0AAN9M2N7_CANGL
MRIYTWSVFSRPRVAIWIGKTLAAVGGLTELARAVESSNPCAIGAKSFDVKDPIPAEPGSVSRRSCSWLKGCSSDDMVGQNATLRFQRMRVGNPWSVDVGEHGYKLFSSFRRDKLWAISTKECPYKQRSFDPCRIVKTERESSLLIARGRLLFLTMNVSLSPHFRVFLDSLKLALSSPILCGVTRF